ncbi:MAG: hypothetical protein ACK57P_14990 [Planctomycetota bacterium]
MGLRFLVVFAPPAPAARVLRSPRIARLRRLTVVESTQEMYQIPHGTG